MFIFVKYRFRCPFVLTLPEAIQKVTVKDGEFCKRCDTALVNVEFNKVGDTQNDHNNFDVCFFKEKNPDLTNLTSACILCHEYFLETIQKTVTYITNMQNRPSTGRGGQRGGRGQGRGRGGGRGGRGRGRGSSRGGGRGGRGRGRN